MQIGDQLDRPPSGEPLQIQPQQFDIRLSLTMLIKTKWAQMPFRYFIMAVYQGKMSHEKYAEKRYNRRGRKRTSENNCQI
jgi:hypothetical protein